MYDELVNALRRLGDWSIMDFEDNLSYANQIAEEAADAIEERCQQVDKFAEEAARLYAKLPRWIPVTERLPEKGRYLALTTPWVNGDEPYAIILRFSENLESVDRYDFEGINRSGWYYYDDEYGNVEVDTVTHWQPLPKGPEEE